MVGRTLPNLALRGFYDLGEDGWKDDMDLNLLKLSVLTQGTVLSFGPALPGAPAAGTVWILDETNGTHPNAVAVFDNGAWVYIVPNEGWLLYDRTADVYRRFDGAAWVLPFGNAAARNVGTTAGTVAAGDDARITGALQAAAIGTSVQAYHAKLDALSGLAGGANLAPYFTGANTMATMTVTAAARSVLDDATTADMLTTLGAVPLAGGIMTGPLTLNADPSNNLHAATKQYVDGLVTGALRFKGTINASGNPNYPAAALGDAYIISPGGRVGGALGKQVDAGDLVFASVANAGGTEAAVGASWTVLEHNLVGALLTANNLGDLTNVATARSNLGLVIGTHVQAWSLKLDAISGAATAADKMIYWTGANTTATTDITAQARTFLAATSQANQRTALGLGTAATYAVGASGAVIPLLNVANTWSATQAFTVISVTDDAYGVGWNANLSVPTKNAIYTKIEALISDATIRAQNRDGFRFDTGQAPAGLALTRASVGTYRDNTGTLQSAANNVARFTYRYNSVTAAYEVGGLLVEASARNTLLYSNDFSNVAWGKVQATITGTNQLIENNTSNSHFIQQQNESNSATGTSYCVSVEAEEIGGSAKRYLFLSLSSNTSFGMVCGAKFDLAIGTIGWVQGSGLTAGVTRVGPTRWLCWIRMTAIGVATFLSQARLSASFSDNVLIYVGDGVSGLALYNFQTEIGTRPTTRIQTTLAYATRAADVATVDWTRNRYKPATINVRFTFSNDTTQTRTAQAAPAGVMTIPTDLDQSTIKYIADTTI